MVFEYLGFIVHWQGIRLYLVIGPRLRGCYIASVNEAVKLIDGFIAGIQCEY
jgi:hypothetical protein